MKVCDPSSESWDNELFKNWHARACARHSARQNGGFWVIWHQKFLERKRFSSHLARGRARGCGCARGIFYFFKKYEPSAFKCRVSRYFKVFSYFCGLVWSLSPKWLYFRNIFSHFVPGLKMYVLVQKIAENNETYEKPPNFKKQYLRNETS